PAADGPFAVPASETCQPGTPAIGENSLSDRHRHVRDRVSYFGYRFAAQEFDARNPAEVAVTQDRVRPAGYIRAPRGGGDLGRQREAIADGARQRGWPTPTVYLDSAADLAGGRAPALARLEAAIEAGRHDALLITDPGAVTGIARHLMGLLQRCTRNG